MGRRLSTPEWRLCVAALRASPAGASGGDGVLRVGCPLCERMRGRVDAKRSLYCHADGGFSCFRCGAVGALPGSDAAVERRRLAGLGPHGHASHGHASHGHPTADAPCVPSAVYPAGVPPAAPGLRGAVLPAELWGGAYAPRTGLPVGLALPPVVRLGVAVPVPPQDTVARVAAAFRADPRPEWTPPAEVVARVAEGAPVYAWQVPPAGFRVLYPAEALDTASDDGHDEAHGTPAHNHASNPAALCWTPDGAIAPEALAAVRADALVPFRRYVETRRARADDTVGLDTGVARASGLGACVSGPLAGYVVAPVLSPCGTAWWGWVARLVVPHPDPDRAAQQPTYRFAPGMPWHTYLDGEGILDVRTDVPAFVVEGFFDRLHLYPDGVATLSKPTAAQLERLARSRRPVVFVPDGDAWEAAVYHAAMLRVRGVAAGVVRLPPRVDPDEVPEGVLRDAAYLALRSAGPVALAPDDGAGAGAAPGVGATVEAF